MKTKKTELSLLIQSIEKTTSALLFYHEQLEALNKLFYMYSEFKCNESIVNTRLAEINTHKQVDRLFNTLDNLNKQMQIINN